MKKILNYCYEYLFNIVKIGSMVCIFCMIGLLIVDVFFRYFLKKATLISYSMTGYFLVGITYLGLAYTLRQGGHIRVTAVIDCLKPKTKEWWVFFVDCFALFFIIILFIQSTRLVKFSLEVDLKATTFTGEPMWIPQILVPIGLGFFIIEDCRILFLNLMKLLKKAT